MGDKETRITKQIINFIANEADGWVIKHHVSAFSTAGVPDILACINGRFLAVEVKADARYEPSKIQAIHIDRIRAAGGVVFVTHSLDDFRQKLRDRWPTAVDVMREAMGSPGSLTGSSALSRALRGVERRHDDSGNHHADAT